MEKKRTGVCEFCGVEGADRENKEDFFCERCVIKYDIPNKIIWFCAKCGRLGEFTLEQLSKFYQIYRVSWAPLRKGIVIKHESGCPYCVLEKEKGGEIKIMGFSPRNFN